MTSRLEPVGAELGDLAALRITSGGVAVELLLLPGGAAAARVSVLVRAPHGDGRDGRACRALPELPPALASTSSLTAHIDMPFHNDREVGVVEHLFAEDAVATLEEFRAELWSASFDARRLALE